MSVDISAKPRPIIPYEHPNAAMYYQLFKTTYDPPVA